MDKIKKILISLLSFVIVCLSFVGMTNAKTTASAIDLSGGNNLSLVQSEILSELNKFLGYTDSSYASRQGRVPGSKAEYNSAMYIHGVLDGLTNFKAVNNASTINGVEKFEFDSIVDGKTYVSQNIIFKRESLVETNKKVILGAHYDSAYIGEVNEETDEVENIITDGVNDSAASVATLLTIVKHLDILVEDYGYDIEVIFFGASSNNYEGSSYYLRGQTEEDNKNTLLMINLDKIALGDYNYFYVNEFKTSQEKYISKTMKEVKKLKNENALDFGVSSPNGLNYTHVGLESDHALFMKKYINVLNVFSGNYESKLTFGLSEYADKEAITYTEKDTLAYILSTRASFTKNLANISSQLEGLLSDVNFISEMEKPNNLKAKYEFWTNEKLSVFITAILLVLFIGLYLVIYFTLQAKSRRKAKDSDISQIVFKITSNLGDQNANNELSNAIDEKIKQDTDDEDQEE